MQTNKQTPTGKHYNLTMLLMLFALPPAAPVLAADGEPAGRQIAEDMVVTATRSEERVREIPAKVEVIDSHDIEMTVGETITEQLKKSSSIGVIEYPGALAGIGMRGFRPEFSGITKHSLTLVNGRPAGATNLATVLTDNVERVEVLKGPASSLYGAEAMGGVVNIITKGSKGTPTGQVKVGGGSFDTTYQQANLGGSLFGPLDFDINARNYDQDGDLTMGNGQKRDNTSYRTRNGSLRLGADVGENWRVDLGGNAYQGRDIETPGDLAYGDSDSSSKDIDNYGADIRVSGRIGENDKISLAAYHTIEEAQNYEWWNGGQRIPPYRYYESETAWDGVQLQNTYNWGAHSFIVGGDYQYIEVETRRWNESLARTAPYSPDNARANWAAYGETVWRFLDRSLTLTAGGRFDYFEVETKDTPLFSTPGFSPKSSDFSTFSPRVGANWLMDNGLRFHSTLGQAFVPPNASQMSYDYWTYGTEVDSHTMGNAGLDPEKSTTWDAGVGFERRDWGLSFDATYFYTKVDDRITTVTSTSGRTRTTRYVNSLDANIHGLEIELSLDFGALFDWGRSLKLYLNSTNIFKAEEELDGGGTQDIMNVADQTWNYGIAYEDGAFDLKFHFRSVGRMYDTDWVTTSPTYMDTIEYPTFTVADLVASYTFLDHHKLTFTVDNVFDEDYYEKKGYPKPGRSFFVSYAYTF